LPPHSTTNYISTLVLWQVKDLFTQQLVKQQLGRSSTVNLTLHLTDDTQLRAHGYIADGTLFAEVCWDVPLADSSLGQGTLWGTPEALRRLAELATQAAVQAEEEVCWHAHQAATAVRKEGRVA
jgi:hypothetical protein